MIDNSTTGEAETARILTGARKNQLKDEAEQRITLLKKHGQNGRLPKILILSDTNWNEIHNPQFNIDPNNLTLKSLYKDDLASYKKQEKVVVKATTYSGSLDKLEREDKPKGTLYHKGPYPDQGNKWTIFWNSNDDLPTRVTQEKGGFDLILMRRGICYCPLEPLMKIQSSCCGAKRVDKSDVAFLKKAANVLADTPNAAAYLCGRPVNITEKDPLNNFANWSAAVSEAQQQVVDFNFQTIVEQGTFEGIKITRKKKLTFNADF